MVSETSEPLVRPFRFRTKLERKVVSIVLIGVVALTVTCADKGEVVHQDGMFRMAIAVVVIPLAKLQFPLH